MWVRQDKRLYCCVRDPLPTAENACRCAIVVNREILSSLCISQPPPPYVPGRGASIYEGDTILTGQRSYIASPSSYILARRADILTRNSDDSDIGLKVEAQVESTHIDHILSFGRMLFTVWLVLNTHFKEPQRRLYYLFVF